MLKTKFTTVPILIAFDPEKEIIVKIDALDYALSRTISQIGNNRKLHLIAFYLRKLTLVELNYKIYNKELLAIIECLKE